MARYQEVKDFIEANHRNPSKYVPEERLMVHFLKRCRKLMNAGELKEPRIRKFKELMVLCELSIRTGSFSYIAHTKPSVL